MRFNKNEILFFFKYFKFKLEKQIVNLSVGFIVFLKNIFFIINFNIFIFQIKDLIFLEEK